MFSFNDAELEENHDPVEELFVSHVCGCSTHDAPVFCGNCRKQTVRKVKSAVGVVIKTQSESDYLAQALVEHNARQARALEQFRRTQKL